MHCIECDREREPGENGWVTVFAREREFRTLYCPDCMAEIVRGAAAANDAAAAADAAEA
jgi:uncharacterized protein YlaI